MADKGTILIIEDNLLNLNMVKDLLALAGYQTLEAEEAETGIQLAKDHQPDLVLMDMHLPIMDGYEATRILKTDPQTQNIPVVAFTALAMEDEQRKALAHGCIGIICKPFDARTFAQTVDSFLQGEQPQPDYTLEHPVSAPVQSTMAGIRGPYAKILIVDDQPKNVQMLTDILSNMNHQALQAFSGQEALDLIQKEKPDLVMLDIMMPEMDGFAVLKRLKADAEFKSIPVIIVSALSGSESIVKGLDHGAYDYITKPFNVAEVQARIRAALKTKQLIEMVEQGNQDMEQFLMVASHDMQGPLRKIQQFSGFLRQSAESKLDAEDLEYISKIERNSTEMENLLGDLLTLSRINRKGEAFLPVNLSEVVRETMSKDKSQIQALNAQIEVKDLPMVEADRTQLLLAFHALIDNALKFRHEERAPVIKIQSEILESGCCEITVQDNGIGFDETHLERIFQPFQRLHGVSRYPGKGMGLAIVQKIIERHNGTATAKSKAGEGSTFTILLPLAQRGRGLNS